MKPKPFSHSTCRVNWESGFHKSGITQPLQNVSHVAVVSNSSAFQQPPLEDIERERAQYVLIYTSTMCLVLWLVVQRGVSFFYMCLRASRRMHDQLFRGIIHATMFFFNTNSSGRIINRFSKDISGVDSTLPIVLYESMFVSSACLSWPLIRRGEKLPCNSIYFFFFIFVLVYSTSHRQRGISVIDKSLAIIAIMCHLGCVLCAATNLYTRRTMRETNRITEYVVFPYLFWFISSLWPAELPKQRVRLLLLRSSSQPFIKLPYKNTI